MNTKIFQITDFSTGGIMQRIFRLCFFVALAAIIGGSQLSAQNEVEVAGRLAPGNVRVFVKDSVYAFNGRYVVGGTLIIEPGTRVIFRPQGQLIDSVGGRIIADGMARANYVRTPKGYNPAALAGTTQNPLLPGPGHQGGNGGDGFSGYADLDYFTFIDGADRTINIATQRDLTIHANKYDEMYHVVLNKSTRTLRDWALNPALGANEVAITFEQAIMFYTSRMQIDPQFDINLNLNPWRRVGDRDVQIGQGTKAENEIKFVGQPTNNFSLEWGHIVILPGAKMAFFRNASFEGFFKDTTVNRLPYYNPASFPGLTVTQVNALNNTMRLLSNGSGGAITTFSSRLWAIDCQFRNNQARFNGGAIQFLETPAGFPTTWTNDNTLINAFGAYDVNKNPNINNADGTPSVVNFRDYGGGAIPAIPAIDLMDSPNAEPVTDFQRQAWDDGRLAIFLGRVRNLRFENNKVQLAQRRVISVGGVSVMRDLTQDGDPAATFPNQYGNKSFGGAIYMAGRDDDNGTRLEVGLGVNNSIRVGGNVLTFPTEDTFVASGNEANNYQSSASTSGSRGGAIYVGRYSSLIVGGTFNSNRAFSKFLENPTTGSNAGLFSLGGAIFSENTLGRLQLRGGPARDANGNPTIFSNNRAGAGGAVYVDGNTSELASPIIGGTDNTIETRDYGFNILFENNIAISFGGAVYTKRQFSINGSGGVEANTLLGYGGKYPVRFWNNTAGYAGGGIHAGIPNAAILPNHRRAINIVRASFRDNVVGENIAGTNRTDIRGGGALYVLSADLNVVKGTEFIANKVYNGNGGAVALVHPQTTNNRYFLSDLDMVTYTGATPSSWGVATSYVSSNEAFTYGNANFPADVRMLTRFIQNEVITNDEAFRAAQSSNGATQIGKGTYKTNEVLHGTFWNDGDNGWAVGYNGTIVRLTGGGANWDYKVSGTTRRLKGITFTSATTGFVVGADGWMLRTNDGGNSWSRVTLPADATSFPNPTDKQINAVHFVNATTGFAVTNAGNFLSTQDGGATWTLTNINANNLNAVHFVTGQLGYVAGDNGTVLKTVDGGGTWSTLVVPNFTDNVYGISFQSTDNGVIVGGSGKISRTQDGGNNWATITSGTTNDLTSVRFVNASEGYATGMFRIGLKTLDGGASWSAMTINLPNSNSLYASYFPNSSVGYMVGDDGAIIKTTNAGTSWSTVLPADQQLVEVQRYHKEINLAENGIGLGGALFILDSITASRANRIDSVSFNRVRMQNNMAFSGAAIYSDNYDLKLIFNRSLITGNEASSEIGMNQNTITGPIIKDNNNIRGNTASNDLAGAIIYGEIQGPLPSNLFSESANSIYDNKARFLVRLPDAPNTKGVLMGTTGIGYGGVDTLRGNYWGHTEANVTMEIKNLNQGTTFMSTFFVDSDGENHLRFLTQATSDPRNQGPFESMNRFAYIPIVLENDANDENMPSSMSIPEKLLQSGRIYDLYDKGLDIKTADYSNRRMSPIEDFAVGIPPVIKRFNDITKPSNGKYVKRTIRDPFVLEALDDNGNQLYSFMNALQQEYAPDGAGKFYHPIGMPLYLESMVDYSGLAERSNHDPLTKNQTVMFVINETTNDYIRVNMNQVSEDAPLREVFRTRVELVPDSTTRNPNTLIRRTIEGLLNLGTGNVLLANIEKNPYQEDRATLLGRKYQAPTANFGNATNLFSNRPNMPVSNNGVVTYWAGERYSALPVNVGDVVSVVSRTVLWNQGAVPAYNDGIRFEISRTVEAPRWTGNTLSLQQDTIIKIVPSERFDRREAVPPINDTIKMVELLNKVFITEDRSYPVRAGEYSNSDDPDIGLGESANGRDSIFTATAFDVNNFYDPRAIVDGENHTYLEYGWNTPANSGLRNWLMFDKINAGDRIGGRQNPRDGATGYIQLRGKPTNPYVVPGGERVNMTVSNFPPHFRTIDNLKQQGILGPDSIAKLIELYKPYLHAPKYDDENARYMQQDTIFIANQFTSSYAFDIFVIDSVPRFLDWNSQEEVIVRNRYDRGQFIEVDTTVVYVPSVNRCGFTTDGRLRANVTDKLRFQIDLNTDDELEDAWAEKVHNWRFDYGRTSYGFVNLFISGGDTIVIDTTFAKDEQGNTQMIMTQSRPAWMSDKYLHQYESDVQQDQFGEDFMINGQINVRIPRNEAMGLMTPVNAVQGYRNVDTTFSIIVNDGHGGKLIRNFNVFVNVAPEVLTENLPNAKEGTDYNPQLIDSLKRIRVYDPNFNQTHKFTLLKNGYVYTENGWSDPNTIPRDPCFPEAGTWDITNLKTTPEWLQINEVSGILYGTPGVEDAPKTERVTVLVQDSDGLTVVKSFNLIVDSISHRPMLTANPEVICVGFDEPYEQEITLEDLDLERTNDGQSEIVTISVVQPAGFTVTPSQITRDNKNARIVISTPNFRAAPAPDGKVDFVIEATDLDGNTTTLRYRLKLSDPTDFVTTLRVENSLGSYQDLQWGTASQRVSTGDGIDGQERGKLDSNLCEYELPPVPVLDVFDARWTIPQVNGTLRNIYPSNLPNPLVIYVGSVQPGGETGGSSPNYPLYFKWDISEIPGLNDQRNPSNGTWYLQDAGSNGNIFSVNMRNPNFRILSAGVQLDVQGDDATVVVNNTAVTSFAILYDVFSDVEENTLFTSTEITNVTPNPVSDNSMISVQVAKSAFVNIDVIDVLGNVVATIASDNLQAGIHTFMWNGKDATGYDLGNGTYNVRLNSGGMNSVYPIVIVK